MQSRKLGAGIAVAALAVAVALFLVLRDDEGGRNGAPVATETTTTTTTTDETSGGGGGDPGGGADPQPEEPEEPDLPTVVVRDGEPVGGVAELDFRRAEQARFVVRSNTDDEVHVHGYDVYADVVAGERNVVSFPAALEGVFEAELHGSGVQIARIAVRP